MIAVTSLTLQQFVETLWPPDSAGLAVWTILDAARDSRIYGAVDGTYLDKCCLFSGDLPWQLQMTAPYLVRLERGDPFTRYLGEHGWGRAWGIFLRSNAGIQTLRRHFRGFLRVKDTKGRHMLFRYYDPRVMRVYLPTCTPDELRTVFGPVREFVVEDQQAAPVRYRLEGGRLMSGGARDANSGSDVAGGGLDRGADAVRFPGVAQPGRSGV